MAEGSVGVEQKGPPSSLRTGSRQVAEPQEVAGRTSFYTPQERRPEVGLDSYDRFFPNQDTMPEVQFGNLIAIPFQGDAVRHGNTVFLDDELAPYPDQWGFLATLGKTSAEKARHVVDQAAAEGRVFGVRLPVADENEDDPWTTPPSRRPRHRDVKGPLPAKLRVVLGNEIYVEKAGLHPALRNKIIRIAAFLNPDFYRKQAMRKSTYDTPRIIGCAEDHTKFIGLPIGCLDDLSQLNGRRDRMKIQPAKLAMVSCTAIAGPALASPRNAAMESMPDTHMRPIRMTRSAVWVYTMVRRQ